jgi:hypothetical protein
LKGVGVKLLFYRMALLGAVSKDARIIPAMAAGVADRVWELEDIADLAN